MRNQQRGSRGHHNRVDESCSGYQMKSVPIENDLVARQYKLVLNIKEGSKMYVLTTQEDGTSVLQIKGTNLPCRLVLLKLVLDKDCFTS
jgi:hypothetical protein